MSAHQRSSSVARIRGSSAATQPTVAFLAPEIYPALNPAAGIQHIGGMEVQQTLIGRGLADLGYDVRYITRDFGQPEGLEVAGGTVHIMSSQPGGIPGVRFLYRSLPAIWNALQRADPDIIYVRGCSYLIAVAVWFSRVHRRRVVFAAAHDWDLDPGLRHLPVPVKRLYRHGLRRADRLVVQSVVQQQLLRRHFGRDGRLIRSTCAFSALASEGEERAVILWVGMFREEKQPWRFLELARRFPQWEFVMIGGPVHRQEALFREVAAAARSIPNLVLTGFLSPDAVAGHFRRARVLVNTSRCEGFPNTFLQAWAGGVPVLSTVDPDGVIERHGLGRHAVSEKALERELPEVLGEMRAPMRSIRSYFLTEHDQRAVLHAYHELFCGLGPFRRDRETAPEPETECPTPQAPRPRRLRVPAFLLRGAERHHD